MKLLIVAFGWTSTSGGPWGYGLVFLHGYDKVKLFHGHLSSSNIVVERLGNACISNIGVYHLLHTPFLINNAYKAPELKPNKGSSCSQRKYTQKCQVCSFGWYCWRCWPCWWPSNPMPATSWICPFSKNLLFWPNFVTYCTCHIGWGMSGSFWAQIYTIHPWHIKVHDRADSPWIQCP